MAHRFGAYTGDDGGHEDGNYDGNDCHDDDDGDGDNDDDENVCVEEARAGSHLVQILAAIN